MMHHQKSLLNRIVSFLLVLGLMAGMIVPLMPVTVSAAAPVLDINGSDTYSLFNSGRTGSAQWKDPNPAPDTHTNSGYDLYGKLSGGRFRLGLSFAINAPITEQATLNIQAYDVDEDMKDCGRGYEYDFIYLVDETTGNATQLDGHMSGQSNTWNNSTFKISPAHFQTGHTYHFEMQMSCTGSHNCTYYTVKVRTVALSISGQQVVETGIKTANLSASINANGLVSLSLSATAYTAGDYTLEYKAVHAESGAQKGGKEYTVTIPAQSAVFGTSFNLESGAPRGTYLITLFIKDGAGNVIATRDCTASYGYSAVTYNANGGSQNLPTDLTTYSSGDTVTVKFDYIPSRAGYTFLGWATLPGGTPAEYTEQGTKTFIIGSSDVTLYAVWEEAGTPPIEPPVQTSTGKILVVQDGDPWGQRGNWQVMEDLLADGYITGYDLISSTYFSSFDLSQYSVIYIVTSNNCLTADAVNSMHESLTAFANAGGALIYGLAWQSERYSSLMLPGNVSVTYDTHNYNSIVDAQHSIITGALTGGNATVPTPLYGNAISHSSIDPTSLPEDASVLLTSDKNGKPTLAEFPFGNGHVILSCLTWECFYDDNYAGDRPFSLTYYDDLFVWALSLTGGTIEPPVEPPVHTHSYTSVVTAPTCTAEGYTTHTCACGHSYQDASTPALGHEMSDWCADSEPDCTTPGSQHRNCIRCGEMEEENIPALGHDYVSGTCTRCGAAEPSADTWDGTANTSWYNDYDTIFTLYTAEELAGLAELVNSGNTFSGKTVYLGADIDLAGLEWTPIGKGICTSDFNPRKMHYTFWGNFNGNYHKISNLRILNNKTTFTGLFGTVIDGTVSNLGIENATIDVYISGRSKVGALAGAISGATVLNCYVIDASIISQSSDQSSAACLVGLSGGAQSTITNCFAVGSVQSPNHAALMLGGIYTNGATDITNCYAVGSVEGYHTGSMIGYNSDSQNPYSIISNCFFHGTLSPNYSVGSFYGNSDKTTVSNCYYSYNNAGKDQGTATDASNFASQYWIEANLGWDFTAVWEMKSGASYPTLRGFGAGGVTPPPACNHAYELVETPATCTTPGESKEVCTLCGNVINIHEIPTVDHTEGDWIIDREATEKEDGLRHTECIYCGTTLRSETIPYREPADTSGATVLLVEDALPWDYNSNRDVLNSLKNSGKIKDWVKCSSADVANGTVDFNDYQLVIFASSQNQLFHNNLSTKLTELQNYVADGGSVMINAATGWGAGEFSTFPFGITGHFTTDNNNTIVDATHPIITGCYSDGRILTNDDAKGASMSHYCFTTYPGNATVVFKDTARQATHIEFAYGSGYVVASGLTWEWAYNASNHSENPFYPGYDDCIINALTQGSIRPSCNHSYQLTETPATCTTPGESKEVCTLCGNVINAYYIPALGHSYESAVTREATCTADGIITYTCTHCGHAYEITVHVEHNYVMTVVEPTCTVDGATIYTCTLCGDMNTIAIPAAHSYVSEVTQRPTRDEDGEITYTCSRCGHAYTEVIPASNANVLVIQDRIPWDVNNIPTLLNDMKSKGYIDGWSMTTTAAIGSVELDLFDVILIANDQTTATYNQLQALDSMITDFVTAGGTVIYGACDHGWSGGDISFNILGTVEKTDFYSMHNYIVDATHPIVTGSLTDDKAITNDLLQGTYCSHSGFKANTLPAGYNIILQDGQGNATLAEYPLGAGRVILSGLTWEFYYSRIYNGYTSYSMNVFDDLIAYAINPDSACAHMYDAGTVVEATCTTEGYTVHTCALCGAAYKDTYVAALGHEMGSWIVDSAPDCINQGTQHQTCTRCDETVYGFIPALGHTIGDWVLVSAPTCTTPGLKHRACTVCEAVLVTEYLPFTGHAESDWILDFPSTCVDPGQHHKECTLCRQTLATEQLPLTDHAASDWIIKTAPTATQTGLKVKECLVCHAVLEKEILPVLAKLTVSRVEAEEGSTVRVTVDVQNNPGIIGALLTVSYDPALTLIKAEAGGAWRSLNFTKPLVFNTPCNFVWDGLDSADYSNGTVLVLTFKVPDNVKVDTVYDIAISYTEGNMIDTNFKPVFFEVENGSITVTNTIGDVNDDGIIDVADVITLRRYLAGGYHVTIDEAAADMNADGVITVQDIILLRRFLVS